MAAANADLTLVILDGSDKYWPEACDKIERAIDCQISQTSTNQKMVSNKVIDDRARLYVLNKADRVLFAPIIDLKAIKLVVNTICWSFQLKNRLI